MVTLFSSSRSVVVDDSDAGGVSFGPAEHDAPLVIHANRVKATQVAPQGLQPVPRRHTDIDARGRIDDQELAERGTLDLGRQALDPFPAEEVLGAAISEAGNHAWQY